MRTEHTEVLVVGAGPVGLFAALQLAHHDVAVTIIDREPGVAPHEYACALHQSTLALLDEIGLLEEAVEIGRRIDRVAFYEGAVRQGEVPLSEINDSYPFVLVVPQGWLEDALEKRLKHTGVDVWWDHRLESIDLVADAVEASVQQFGGSGFGYSVPHWESIVKKRFPIQAQFIIGADGPNSTMRNRMGVELETYGAPRSFVIYEFETDDDVENEMRVAMGAHTTDVFWPMARNHCHWTFELPINEKLESADEERAYGQLSGEQLDDIFCAHAKQAARVRAPWFTTSIQHIIARKTVEFQPGLVRSLGKKCCWLTGDAAHQTLPFGMQSMNAGFHEVKTLAHNMHRVLRHAAPALFLDDYNRDCHAVWSELLSDDALKPGGGSSMAIAHNAARILPCLPASGDDLKRAAHQLNLVFATDTASQLAYH
jgi:NADPH-dependent dioxygenase